jgi:putative phosphoribosyl transferase
MTMWKPFQDRTSAGKELARAVAKAKFADPVVLALPRGGVPVAAEVARSLNSPLDIVLVRKIGVPEQPELAAAAVVDGGEPEIVVNEEVAALCGITRAEIDERAKVELEEIERRRSLYLPGRTRVPLEGRAVIVVDDGIATGTTMRAALKALREKKPKALILAVPVAPGDTVAELRAEVDELICLKMPEPFIAIGLHYRDFHQVSDEEVVRVLSEVNNGARGGPAADRGGAKLKVTVESGAPPATSGRLGK